MTIERCITWLTNSFTTTTMAVVFLFTTSAFAQSLSDRYPLDAGIGDDPKVLYFSDFDDEITTWDWIKDYSGYGWTSNTNHVFHGDGALEIQQTVGTHEPFEIYPKIAGTDVAYVRWYRKWETSYDFTQHKMPGVYAYADGRSGGGAGEVPTGYDKFSCKLTVTSSGHPRFYTYHPEQSGPYGDELPMNLVDEEYTMETDRWYCFEMMIKANNPPAKDGELKMWIDGELVAHYDGMRFRDTKDLKINTFTYSAYVGGSWTSDQNQNLWDDQIIVATTYIGPLSTGADEDSNNPSDPATDESTTPDGEDNSDNNNGSDPDESTDEPTTQDGEDDGENTDGSNPNDSSDESTSPDQNQQESNIWEYMQKLIEKFWQKYGGCG